MIAMEIFFIFLLFIMGSVFGSFFTLAVYRIPLNLDITHSRSFCPNCNHRLEFKDLIPIFSYISLKGKCRYCGNPVRIRYLLLEFLSGIIFVCAYFVFKLNFPFFTIESVANYIGFIFFYITNAIILGIDKEYLKIDKRVLLFGIITNSIYMLYLHSFQNLNLYKYMIYLLIIFVLFCLDTIFIKKFNKNYYWIQILMLVVFELSYIGDFKKIFLGIFSFTIAFFIYLVYKRMCRERKEKNKIPLGFCICISSIFSIVICYFL